MPGCPSGSARRSARPTLRRGRRWEARAWALGDRGIFEATVFHRYSLLPVGPSADQIVELSLVACLSFARRRKNLLALFVADRDGPVGAALRGLQDWLISRAGRIDQLDLLVGAESKHRRRPRKQLPKAWHFFLLISMRTDVTALSQYICDARISDIRSYQELQQRHFLVAVDQQHLLLGNLETAASRRKA